MPRTLFAPLLGRNYAWVLGGGLVMSFMIGCGTKGDNADDSAATGGAGYVVRGGQGGQGNRGTGGSSIYQPGQGGYPYYGQGGQVANTVPSNCTTGTLNCPCYSSSVCATGLTCNASKICVGNGAGAGGNMGTGTNAPSGCVVGSQGCYCDTLGSCSKGLKCNGSGVCCDPNSSTCIATTFGTGGSTFATGGAMASLGGATGNSGGTKFVGAGGKTSGNGGAATGGIMATGGAVSDAGPGETGGSTSIASCDQNVINSPHGVVACTGDCTITSTVKPNDASVTYNCECVDGSYTCFGSPSNTVACPAGVATGEKTGCKSPNDDFCKLLATVTTTSGGTVTTTMTTYSCVCDASASTWTCTK